jgi:hypothetical protein
MRNRRTFDYLRKGQLIKRIYQDEGSYEEVARPFRYKSTGQTIQSSGQLMNGFMHTDTSARIEAITDLPYDKGDKVILDNGERYEISQVQTVSIQEFGRLRNIRRSAKLLSIT